MDDQLIDDDAYQQYLDGIKIRMRQKGEVAEVWETMTPEQQQCVGRVSEDSYRRGFQHGQLGARDVDLRHNVQHWRWGSDLDVAEPMFSGPVEPSVERVRIEFKLPNGSPDE